MAKQEAFQDLALSSPRTGEDLWRWLYTELRAAILEGRLRPGTRLPSTRSLAKQYSISRGTVVAAFAQLQSEGYVGSQMSAGTYVALTLQDKPFVGRRRKVAPAASSKASISRSATAMMKEKTLILSAPSVVGKAFRSYEPAIDLFPVELWTRVASRVLRHAPRSLYGQGNPAGYPPLRRAIADYLGASRGVRCTPEQIIVTAGAQQALDLLARLLLDSGDQVWVEDPGYPGAWQALRAAGATLVAVRVDAQGLNVAQGRLLAPRARMAYVTPANQFPLGTVMTATRRLELLNWAASANAWVVEDEYDAEYRYSGKPVAALQSLDRLGCVIYVGTFTKMLFNALRLGFVVLPERLVETFEAVRSAVDRHPPTLDQAILAEFISEGYFGHHVWRMRQAYAERMGVLKEASDQHLGGLMNVVDANAGMKTIGWLKNDKSDILAANRAKQAGLEVLPLSTFSLQHVSRSGLLLGFAGCSPDELRRGVTALARALQKKTR